MYTTTRDPLLEMPPMRDEPDLLLLRFLQNDYGVTPAIATTIARRRTVEWAREWVSLWPYYRKPIANEAGFLVDADAGSWPFPPALIKARDRERAEVRQLQLRADDFTARKSAKVAEPPTAFGPPTDAEIASSVEKRAEILARLRRTAIV